MSNTIQPTSLFTGIAIEALQRFDSDSNKVLTKSLGDVERCVIGYSSRDGFFGKLSGLIYRVWNAVKAVFGQSDWQKARRGLKQIYAQVIDHPIMNKGVSLGLEIGGEFAPQLKKFSAEGVINLSKMFLGNIPKEGLDTLLKWEISLNENKGVRNIINDSVVQKLIGTPKEVVDTFAKFYEIYEENKALISQLAKGEIEKEEAMLKISKIFNDVSQIETIKHIVQPIINAFPKILELVKEGNELAVLRLFAEDPELTHLIGVVMKNIPELNTLYSGGKQSFGEAFQDGFQKGISMVNG